MDGEGEGGKEKGARIGKGREGMKKGRG